MPKLRNDARWPEIERLAKTRAPEAIGVLSKIMLDKNEAGATRVSAANAILDRGYGKPKSRVDVSGTIDVNGAHLQAIKALADQVKAETRLIAAEGKPRHEIEVIPVIVSEGPLEPAGRQQWRETRRAEPRANMAQDTQDQAKPAIFQ